MPEETIRQILIRRDKMSEIEADDLISEAKIELNEAIENCELETAYDLIEQYFGLEPDYLEEFLYPNSTKP